MGAAKARGNYEQRKQEAERRNARRAENAIQTGARTSGARVDLRPRAIPRSMLGVLAAIALNSGRRPR